ncbi:hypothetical protein ACHAXR_010558 [Thalassiosira sp. AJA248-18]
MKRLILERGGGKSLLLSTTDEDAKKKRTGNNGGGGESTVVAAENNDVTWEMYNLHSVIHYLNSLYTGKEFVDRILGSIVTTLEEEYEGTNEEVPYKDIMASLCDHGTAHAATAAEHILHRFESRLMLQQQEQEQHDNRSANTNYDYYHSNPPTVETYNNILTCWKKSGQTSYPSNAIPEYMHHPNPCSNLLMQMLQLYDNNNNGDTMDVGDVNGDTDGGGGGGNDELGTNHIMRIRPDFITFNTTISSLAREQIDQSWRGSEYHRTIGKQCYLHLMKMLEFYNEGDKMCAPDLITFSTVLNTLGRGKSRGDETRAREVLDIMLNLSGVVLNDNKDEVASAAVEGSSYEFDVVPRNKHFNVVLALMANTPHANGEMLKHAKRYVDIMEKLGKREKEGNYNPSQDLPQTHNQSEVQEELMSENPLLDEEEFAFDHHHHHSMTTEGEKEQILISHTISAPDIITYNTLLKIAARVGRPEMAEDILEGMIEKSSKGESEVKPDNVSFNTVLLAWSKSRSVEGKLRTQQILHRMQEMADSGDSNVRPDRTSMTTVINAIIASAKRNRSAHIQAEKIVERMEANKDSALQPDVVTYTSLIKCWTESGRSRAAGRAEEIINLLHQRYDEGHDECKPDTLVYNVAMNALAKSDAHDSAERAEALLNRMQDHYYAGDADLTPTTQSFSTVIQAWARSKDPNGAMKAEKLLQNMHDLEESGVGKVSPNTIAYSTCILAWRNSGGRDAGKHVDALLNKMEQYEAKGIHTLKPNAISYTNAMEAWISSRQPKSLERVEAILERMIERSKEGDYNSAPTSTTFNVVMKAIQHSSHPMKHEKAEQLLNHMKEMHGNGDKRVMPTIITYNTFFSACSRTKGNTETRVKAFSLVLNALIELLDHKHLRADLYTWPAVWNACQELLEFKKDLAWINRIFELTIKSGFVNEYLFNNLRRYLPPQYLQKKLKTTKDVQQLTVLDLPPEWTCNVKLARGHRENRSNKHTRSKVKK